MSFDAERAWRQLKAAIVDKPHHGSRDLLATMARLEVENDDVAPPAAESAQAGGPMEDDAAPSPRMPDPTTPSIGAHERHEGGQRWRQQAPPSRTSQSALALRQ